MTRETLSPVRISSPRMRPRAWPISRSAWSSFVSPASSCLKWLLPWMSSDSWAFGCMKSRTALLVDEPGVKWDRRERNVQSLRCRARGQLGEVQIAVARTVKVWIVDQERGPEWRAPQSGCLRDSQ